MKAKFTGYAKDINDIASILERLATLSSCKPAKDYYEPTPEGLVYHEVPNATNENFKIVAVGLHAEGGNVHIPCIAKNDHVWVYARDIVETKKGFCWSNGNYCDTKDEAKKGFNELIGDGGLLWYTEEYEN